MWIDSDVTLSNAVPAVRSGVKFGEGTFLTTAYFLLSVCSADKSIFSSSGRDQGMERSHCSPSGRCALKDGSAKNGTQVSSTAGGMTTNNEVLKRFFSLATV